MQQHSFARIQWYSFYVIQGFEAWLAAFLWSMMLVAALNSITLNFVSKPLQFRPKCVQIANSKNNGDTSVAFFKISFISITR